MRKPIRYIIFCIFLSSVNVSFSQDLLVYISDQKPVCQKSIDVPVRVSRFRGMITMQGSVQWDTATLRFDSLSSFGPSSLSLTASNFGTTMASEGVLVFSWDDALLKGVTLPDFSELFTMRFTILTRENTETILTLGSQPVAMEFVDTTQSVLRSGTRNGRFELNFDIPTFNPFKDTTKHCGEMLELDAGKGFTTYDWNGLGVGQKLNVTKTGFYTVFVQNENGCKGKDSSYVQLFPVPVPGISISGDTILCEGSQRILSATGGTAYAWYRDSAKLTSRVSDTLRVSQGGKYTVEVSNSFGCSARPALPINILLATKPTLSFELKGECIDVNLMFFNRSTLPTLGQASWLWSFSDGSTSELKDSVVKVFKRVGEYNIVLKYQNSICPQHTDTVSKKIQLRREKDQRYKDVLSIINHPTQLEARPEGVVYKWSPALGLSADTIRNPVTTLSTNQNYIISITLVNGCVVFDTLAVKMSPNAAILLPKAFSPNNDGQNDLLTPFLIGIKELSYFRVYNRWGNLVFESNGRSAQLGWDGSYRGVRQPMDTYMWNAAGVDVKGSPVAGKGSTFLIR